MLRDHALATWNAAVDAARARDLVRDALVDPARPLRDAIAGARRVLVCGCGKAGAAMSQGVEDALAGQGLARVEGLVNVPDTPDLPALERIPLHRARPAGSNFPTPEGVAGAEKMLALLSSAGPDDVALCLVSGGGSALLPAPVPGVSLEDKQEVTRLLHASGATIGDMNTVRKHLSRVKGGRLAQAFPGRALFSLIVSDVIGDPLDVIASGPTVADPSTFAQALEVLTHFKLLDRIPTSVRDHLERGLRGEVPETPKQLPGHVHNLILANNSRSLRAAQRRAEELGYRVLNLGSFIEGETRHVAVALAGIARSILTEHVPLAPPVCLLSGGDTTVTQEPGHGKGGRNQEFALAAGLHLLAGSGPGDLDRWVVLSGGTDGED